MGKLKLLTGLIISVAAVTFVWSGLASAHSFRTGDNVTVRQNQTINQSLFTAGRTIDISSTVEGDVFCAGQNITISGTVRGDVICAGQSIHIRGNVEGDIRLAGQNITVGATVSGNATVAAQTFTLDSKGVIKGDITVAGTDATFNGEVDRDIVAGTDTLIIASSIGRDIKATVDNFRIEPGARIAGNVEYTSNQRLNQSRDAEVGGEITRHEPTATSSKRGAVLNFSIWWFVYWFVAMLLTALALVLLFPRIFQTTVRQALPWPWRVLLAGFVASFAVPILCFVLAITIVGIPLALLIGLLWLVILLLSGPFFAYYLGRVILQNPRHPVLIMFVGATVLLVLYFIPVLGFIALLLAMWVGSGMILLEAFRRTPRPAYAIDTTPSHPVSSPITTSVAQPSTKKSSNSKRK